MLSYYSCLDDWADEKDPKKKMMAAVLRSKNEAASQRYPEKAALIERKLSELHELEAAASSGASKDSPAVLMDKAGAIFGDLMAEIFEYRKDMWSIALRRMGFYLGRFIYILDAYDDLEKDEKSGSFNPLLPLKDRLDFTQYVKAVLTMAISECTAAFETLPIVENVDILRNILYSGVWCKFDDRNRKRQEAQSPDVSTERTAQDE